MSSFRVSVSVVEQDASEPVERELVATGVRPADLARTLRQHSAAMIMSVAPRPSVPDEMFASPPVAWQRWLDAQYLGQTVGETMGGVIRSAVDFAKFEKRRSVDTQPFVFVMRAPTCEITASHFVNEIKVEANPGVSFQFVLPEPLSLEPGDTLHVAVVDGHRTVVQHNTEGALARLIAGAMSLPTETANSTLIDRAAVADGVLRVVGAVAAVNGYELRGGRVVDDARRMLTELADLAARRPGSVSLAQVAKWAGLPGDVSLTDATHWATNARAMIERIDEILDFHRAFPATVERTMFNRMDYLERLVERVPPTGEAALGGQTWHDANGSDYHLVLEPTKDGEVTALLSVYVDSDGPSVALDAAQLRQVAARLLARAATLEANVQWEDPHAEVKGTVGWPTIYDPEVSSASVNCCGRIECIDAAADWVQKVTGHLGVWTVYAKSPSEDR
jgi:hypothetical protein